MATNYKALVQNADGTRIYLFDGKDFKTKLLLINRIKTAVKKHKLDGYEKFILEETQFFERGPNATIWPDGQKKFTEYNIAQIMTDEIDNILIKKRPRREHTDVSVRYYYETQYISGVKRKYLPQNVNAAIFVDKIKNVDFNGLNFVLLTREATNLDDKVQTFREIMLYNPSYKTYDLASVFIGSKYNNPPKVRRINKHDIPFTETILNNWVADTDNINQTLLKFFGENVR